MKKIILGFITICSMASCVSKSEYDRLKAANNELIQKLAHEAAERSKVQMELDQLVQQIREERTQTVVDFNKKPYVSATRALEIIEEHYSFYERDKKYRNVILRRAADNSFKVSLEECLCKSYGRTSCCELNVLWDAKVKTLTIRENDKYDFVEDRPF
jgi:hypothetical protein